tara:strand:- start:101 stop:964 length:864 start_codon:yes stop_codon:yes gene_type:complete
MSNLIFQGAFSLQSATPEEDYRWWLGIRFRDNEGIFTADDIQAGDVIILDTGFFEPGTLTRYEVSTIHSTNWNGTAQVTVHYLEDNVSSSPNPDIRWLVGGDGAIGRPSPVQRLLPVPSSRIQRISDRFSYYVHNHNTFNILDDLSSGSSESVEGIGIVTLRLPVEAPGTIKLPSKPMGGLVFDMAMLHCDSGAVIEVTGVSVEKRGESYIARLEADDYAQFETVIHSVTVSYMGDLEDSTLALDQYLTNVDLVGFGVPLGQTLGVRDLNGFTQSTRQPIDLATLLG